MKWIYYMRKGNLWENDQFIGIQQVYLRPVWEEKGDIYTSGIISLRITALEFMDSAAICEKLNNEEKEYLDKIKREFEPKEFHIKEVKLSDEENKFYLNQADLYIQREFSRKQCLDWVLVYLAVNGYPCDALEEADFEKFASDVNPVLGIFSLENVQRFDHILGQEWWKEKFTAEIDKNEIQKLLDNLLQN